MKLLSTIVISYLFFINVNVCYAAPAEGIPDIWNTITVKDKQFYLIGLRDSVYALCQTLNEVDKSENLSIYKEKCIQAFSPGIGNEFLKALEFIDTVYNLNISIQPSEIIIILNSENRDTHKALRAILSNYTQKK